MSVKRLILGLLWIVWAGFWTQIAHETLGWSAWISLAALLITPLAYNLVANWWMPISGFLSFVLFGLAGAGGMWLWSITSPIMQYSPTNFLEWVVVGLFWGYIGVAIAKVYLTLEAIFHDYNFTPAYLYCLKTGEDWLRWVRTHRDLVNGGTIPRQITFSHRENRRTQQRP